MNKWKKILRLIQEAGKAVVNLQHTNFSITRKENNDLVTEADLLVNAMLEKELRAFLPGSAWLSEESIDNVSRLMSQYTWIIDPIDGTKEFVEGIPEYSISIALIKDGKPIFAVVYNPAKEDLFYAIQYEGAYFNNNKISCHLNTQDFKKPTVLASRSEYEKGVWTRFYPHFNIKPIGSIAYKMALVAAGFADATFSLGPKNIWDVAAGALIVQEAGGIVSDKAQQSLKFNDREIKVNGIIASNAMCHEYVLNIIK